MTATRLVLVFFLAVALVAPDVSAGPAEPAVLPDVTSTSITNSSMLFVENIGQWPEDDRFQVWGSLLGTGTTWLAQDAIWLVVA